MQSKATEPMPEARKVLADLTEPLAVRLPRAVQHQEARRLLARQHVSDEHVPVKGNAETAHHLAPHSASRRPEERWRRRETAASKTDPVPQISTRERARVMPV